ncbi:Rieske (2Fe-2S) protein [Aureimonas glaciei]|uniref:(2Fe-2S)-binding protein n=1 Tax=Aureimonas glaciei TaxID=1776957 RepID=A0A916XZ72_9HYPH|nr:Rieske (2Fe-2S) protein [Aureimonas glaciei]GGD23629.1 (2Fe-2S)-binding protein [Aureimonas glaciei]
MPEFRVGRQDEFADGDKRLMIVGGVEVGLFRLDGDIFCWRNICPHQGGPVCQGQVFRRVLDVIDESGQQRGRTYHDSDKNIVCPWHGAEFDIRTGRHAGTGRLRLRAVATEIRDGEVYLHVDSDQ